MTFLLGSNGTAPLAKETSGKATSPTDTLTHSKEKTEDISCTFFIYIFLCSMFQFLDNNSNTDNFCFKCYHIYIEIVCWLSSRAERAHVAPTKVFSAGVNAQYSATDSCLLDWLAEGWRYTIWQPNNLLIYQTAAWFVIVKGAKACLTFEMLLVEPVSDFCCHVVLWIWKCYKDIPSVFYKY